MHAFHIQYKANQSSSNASPASDAPLPPLSNQLQLAFENAFAIVYDATALGHMFPQFKLFIAAVASNTARALTVC
jgi:hypothetical protein